MRTMSPTSPGRSGWSAFFFSSRRRHTSYIGDWSSDVCSSDLRHAEAVGPRPYVGQDARVAVHVMVRVHVRRRRTRSEERRVGKECGALELALVRQIEAGDDGERGSLPGTVAHYQRADPALGDL